MEKQGLQGLREGRAHGGTSSRLGHLASRLSPRRTRLGSQMVSLLSAWKAQSPTTRAQAQARAWVQGLHCLQLLVPGTGSPVWAPFLYLRMGTIGPPGVV